MKKRSNYYAIGVFFIIASCSIFLYFDRQRIIVTDISNTPSTNSVSRESSVTRDVDSDTDYAPIHLKSSNETGGFSDPHSIYLKHIDAAHKGVPRDQYLVSYALNQCEWPTKPSANYHDELKAKLELAGYDRSIIDSAFARSMENAKECAPIYDALGKQNLKIMEDAWRDAAAEAGDPFARLENLKYHSIDVPESDYLEVLYEALEHSADNPILRSKALRGGLYYHSQYGDDLALEIETGQKPTRRRGVERDAWEFMSCDHSPNCNLSELLEELSSTYLDHELDQRIARAKELFGYINEEKWDHLNLPKR